LTISLISKGRLQSIASYQQLNENKLITKSNAVIQ
jgi:hypothetical protein